MNDKKICFLTCVNNEAKYKESLLYISRLNIPEGYEIESAAIRNASSMASGYNRGMTESDAKFKVYLHQDTFILNRDFISDLLKIFKSDEKIGLIGVAGAKTIPADGVWWNSTERVGRVYDNHTQRMELLEFCKPSDTVDDVKAVDGLLFATQYDVPFREDIFNGWDFYDVSEALEFIKHGYRVVVPSPEKVWCLHDCGIPETGTAFDQYRHVLINEYLKDSLPLVSILIPTYNRPEFFELALTSALVQTYPNIEIIVGDDSTDTLTEKLMQEKYLTNNKNITYYHNEKNLGQFDNDLKLMEMAKGEYVNFLMDDDLFLQNKIEKMMAYFIADKNDEISLVTSNRAVIDGNGKFICNFGQSDNFLKGKSKFEGSALGNEMLKTSFNFIGEPTTVLFKKSKLMSPFGTLDGRRYYCNVDQASWLELLSKGKAIFINEVLSCFRCHENQQSKSLICKLGGMTDYAHQLLVCKRYGFLINTDDYRISVSNFKNYSNEQLKNIDNVNLTSEEASIYKEFTSITDTLFSKNDAAISAANIPSTSKPLVSILIPAYNQTKYLKIALESAIAQTYNNIEIIIGDDSTNDEVEKFVKPYLEKYENIHYFRNKKAKNDYGLTNSRNLIKASKGKYISFLFHDDIIAPNKIEYMINYAMCYPNVSLITSFRQPIDSNGMETHGDVAFQKIFETDQLISGHQLMRIVLLNKANIIGEPSVVMVEKKYIDSDDYYYFAGEPYNNNVDLAMWFNALEHGDAIYIAKPLTSFRIHGGQNSAKIDLQISGNTEWLRLLMKCRDLGYIESNCEYNQLMSKYIFAALNFISDKVSQAESYPEIYAKFQALIKKGIDQIFSSKKSTNRICIVQPNDAGR